MPRLLRTTLTTAQPHRRAVVVFGAMLVAACGDVTVTGEGQFGRPISLVSEPEHPLPRLIWRPGEACPGPEGGCEDFCVGTPDDCGSACQQILIDSGTPLSILPSSDGTLSDARECVELRAGVAELLAASTDAELLADTTASFRLIGAPILRAPADAVGGWNWEVGDEQHTTSVGAVIGGNVLRDFAIELRHLEGEPASVSFFTQYPGNEDVLGDQGRAYLRLQHPGRLLGRLLNDHCEFETDAESLDCQLSRLSLSQNDQQLLFESTRALVDACVAPPPCTVSWASDSDACSLSRGGVDDMPCPHEVGRSATLLVATGVPGLVLFDDSAAQLLGPLASLPSCEGLVPDAGTMACTVSDSGRLALAGWPPLDSLLRIKVRSLGIVEGLDQASGLSPCDRLRDRLQGVVRQCDWFLSEGLPIRPVALTSDSVASSVFVVGEAALPDDALAPDPDRWLDTLIVPAAAPPVLALRREIVPEGAQPDGLVGGALLHQTETVLDFTEAVEKPGVRVRCLDPGPECLAIPACTAAESSASLDDDAAGRTNCCFGLPSNLIASVVLEGINKQPPRVEDACCSALPRAALVDLQSDALGLCTGVDMP